MYGIYIKNTALKNYIKLVQNNEHKKALELLEKDKKRTIFGLEHESAIAYLYFITNNYEKYLTVKKEYTPMDFEKKPEIYFRTTNLFKITEMIFMYLHEQVEDANMEYKRFIEKDNDIEKRLYYIDYKTWVLFQALKMIYLYNDEKYVESKRMYECISMYAYNHTVKALISYYMCRIYEIEGEMEAIKIILFDADIQNNPYRIYFDKWREK
ncbi:MAG: hypothetical protein AAGU14_09270 [Eubacteriaceae bacterium]